jgi:hypothetical protein
VGAVDDLITESVGDIFGQECDLIVSLVSIPYLDDAAIIVLLTERDAIDLLAHILVIFIFEGAFSTDVGQYASEDLEGFRDIDLDGPTSAVAILGVFPHRDDLSSHDIDVFEEDVGILADGLNHVPKVFDRGDGAELFETRWGPFACIGVVP